MRSSDSQRPVWRIDALFVNAGVAKFAPIHEVTAALRRTVGHQSGSYFTIKARHYSTMAHRSFSRDRSRHAGSPGLAFMPPQAALRSLGAHLCRVDRAQRPGQCHRSRPHRNPYFWPARTDPRYEMKLAKAILGRVPACVSASLRKLLMPFCSGFACLNYIVNVMDGG